MLLELRDVCYTFMSGSPVEVAAVSGVSFAVGAGEMVAMIGPTGSGKSTLTQIMAGLMAPTSGQVIIDGTDLAGDRKEAARCRRSIGIIFQQPEKQLFETTVEEDVAFWPRNVGIQPELIAGRVRSALRMVGLDYDKFRARSPFTLSGGERRKVAIAGTLVMEPGLLIMDEPTVGLDPRSKDDLLETVKALHRAGTTIVMVTHDLDDVAELAERVLLLEEGRLVLDAGPRQVFAAAGLRMRSGSRQAQPVGEIDLPTAVNISRLLLERGFAVEGEPLTIEELVEGILASMERASA